MKREGIFCDTKIDERGFEAVSVCPEIAIGKCVSCDEDVCAKHGRSDAIVLTLHRAVMGTSSQDLLANGTITLCAPCLGKLAGKPYLFKETIVPSLLSTRLGGREGGAGGGGAQVTISRADASNDEGTMALLTTSDNEERLKAHLVAEALAGNDGLDIRRMTVDEFRGLPARTSWSSEESPFTSLVIVPREEDAIHESGWRMLDFVGIRGNSPICRLSGKSDALQMPEVGRWEMDCLQTSGLLHLWNNTQLIVADAAFSTFTLKCVPRNEPK